MATVVAVHKITWNPSGRMEATGRYDAEGNAVFRSKPDTIHPETVFEIADGATLDELRSLGSVRDASDAEIAIWKSEQSR